MTTALDSMHCHFGRHRAGRPSLPGSAEAEAPIRSDALGGDRLPADRVDRAQPRCVAARACAGALLQLDAGPAAEPDPARAPDLHAVPRQAAGVPRRRLLDDHAGADLFSDMFLRDTAVAPALLKAWEERRYQPVMLSTSVRRSTARRRRLPARARAPRRDAAPGARHARRRGPRDQPLHLRLPSGQRRPRQAYLAQLLAPSLHAAWVRTQLTKRADGAAATRPPAAACSRCASWTS